MNAIRRVSLTLASAAMLLPGVAAADGGIYVGAGLGSANLSDDFDGLTIDADATAFRLFAGWRINDYVAVEGGYQDFGDFEQTIDFAGSRATASLSADGFFAGADGALPLSDRFALTGRLGMFFWDGNAEINAVSQASPEDSNLYYGVGGRFELTPRLALTGDWSRYELEDTDSRLISVGLRYGFD